VVMVDKGELEKRGNDMPNDTCGGKGREKGAQKQEFPLGKSGTERFRGLFAARRLEVQNAQGKE